ncbi:hypothetical protein GDO81_014656 [Engystomops pustulosus]|uniref:Uncharacterized protein n=1 Tax=Engystomops pustulosus TaxID=76066 RepID=A0AAV7BC78_ENGPU|nr:hypothetical protein GDO81_014656 [Engystomops pustulosus]
MNRALILLLILIPISIAVPPNVHLVTEKKSHLFSCSPCKVTANTERQLRGDTIYHEGHFDAEDDTDDWMDGSTSGEDIEECDSDEEDFYDLRLY